MFPLKYLFIRAPKIYALVGKSGTGKSFRSKLIMEKYNIEMLIDDGLLIKESEIIAGRSAKREETYMSAVRVALFTDPIHRKAVQTALQTHKSSSILILGTSENMIQKIIETLELPKPTNIIKISDIATTQEIQTAIHYRHHHGSHVLPVPAIEVQRNHPKMIIDAIQILFSKNSFLFKKRKKIQNATITRPAFSEKGTIQITVNALSQMIMHCIEESEMAVKPLNIKIREMYDGYHIKVMIEVLQHKKLVSNLSELRNYIFLNIEKFTGILIKELDIIIDNINVDHRKVKR